MDILLGGVNPTHTHKMDCPKLRGKICNCDPKPIKSDIWNDFHKTFINSTEWAEHFNQKDFQCWYNNQLKKEIRGVWELLPMERDIFDGQYEHERLQAQGFNECLRKIIKIISEKI